MNPVPLTAIRLEDEFWASRLRINREVTLPALTGIGMGWWTLAFGMFLFAAAHGMEWLERRFVLLRPPHHPS